MVPIVGLVIGDIGCRNDLYACGTMRLTVASIALVGRI